jgi:RND family efflux transporter MFP subunit
MKRFYLTALVALTLVTSGCTGAVTPTPLPAITLPEQEIHESSGGVTASANVVPSQETHLSFVISGMVKDVQVGEGDVVQAGQTLAALNTPELQFAVVSAEAAVRAAELNVTISRYKRKKFNSDSLSFVYQSGPPEAREKADAELAKAQASLDVAKATLAQNTILSPADATVIMVDAAPGEYIQGGQPVILLARLDQLQIETTDLSERDVANVKIGDPALVFIDALNADFPGKVVAISPISNTIGGDVVYTVTIALDERPDGLLWGLSAEVEIDTGG